MQPPFVVANKGLEIARYQVQGTDGFISPPKDKEVKTPPHFLGNIEVSRVQGKERKSVLS